MRYEIVAVDDGSSDGSLEELKVLKRAHPELHIVSFAANAGQTAAFAAGFKAARGAIVVTLDADLQNDPADIPALVAELRRSGATAVAGYRVNRRDTPWKRVQSRIANGIRNRLNQETIRDTGCSLKAFRTEAVRDLPLFAGMHRFLPTLIKMNGGTVAEVPVRHRPRRYGTRSGCARLMRRSRARCPWPSARRWRATWPPARGAPAPGSAGSSSRLRSRGRMVSRMRSRCAARCCEAEPWCGGPRWRSC